jgi:hypothetical protein
LLQHTAHLGKESTMGVIECGCGMVMSIAPARTNEADVRCIRCGAKNASLGNGDGGFRPGEGVAGGPLLPNRLLVRHGLLPRKMPQKADFSSVRKR